MAFEKALKTLEYNKILELLAGHAHTQGAKEMALSLVGAGYAQDSLSHALIYVGGSTYVVSEFLA